MGTIATLERIFWFDDQIRRNRHPNASNLAERFEISNRTSHRCIEAMRDRFGAPLEYDPAKRGYVYSDNSFQLPHFQIGQEELLSVLLARSLLSTTAQGAISRAIGRFGRKLITETGNIGLDAGSIGRLFSAAWTGHAPVPAPIFKTISQALITSRRLSLVYLSPGTGQTTRRTVEPHHLQYYMASWVLTARCLLRDQWRKFYLARMQQAKITNDTFIPRPPAEWRHRIEGAFGIFQGGDTVEVVFRFTPFRARWIKEQVWHPAQQMIPLDDGGLELHLPVTDFREIKMKILQFGADVTVVAPEELKKEVVSEIRKMAGLYAG